MIPPSSAGAATVSCRAPVRWRPQWSSPSGPERARIGQVHVFGPGERRLKLPPQLSRQYPGHGAASRCDHENTACEDLGGRRAGPPDRLPGKTAEQTGVPPAVYSLQAGRRPAPAAIARNGLPRNRPEPHRKGNRESDHGGLGGKRYDGQPAGCAAAMIDPSGSREARCGEPAAEQADAADALPAPDRAAADATNGVSRAALVEKLFREHNESLVRFLSVKLRSWQEAQDVAQEAYVQMLRLETPETVGFLRAFLFKTAANLAITRLRARGVRERAATLELIEQPPESPTPERLALSEEQVRLVSQFLQELPPLYREALMLRRVDGLSCAEISQRMQIPERTVRHYVVEAMVYCQTRLEHVTAAKLEAAPLNGAGVPDRDATVHGAQPGET